MITQCPIRIARPVKYTNVQIKTLKYGEVRRVYTFYKSFFFTDANTLSG
jgi:hypothetical protein